MCYSTVVEWVLYCPVDSHVALGLHCSFSIVVCFIADVAGSLVTEECLFYFIY